MIMINIENNSLLLIDLNRNFNFTETNKNFINLNKGQIHLKNCKKIKLKSFLNFREKSYKMLIKRFKKSILNSSEDKFFLSEMEIFNLRNDRYNFPDRILNFLIIKRIKSKNRIKKIKIISDNRYTLKIFDNVNLEVEKKDLSSGVQSLALPNLRILKFLIKTLFLVLFIKFFKRKKKFNKNKPFYMSLYPNKYFYDKKNLLKKTNNICNFLLTDETHLNLNLKKLIEYAKETNDKAIVNFEQFIKIQDIIILIFKNLLHIIKIRNFKKIKINFEGLYFKDEINDLYNSSYINRSKLEIYSKAIPRFLKNFNVSVLNIYMFEYSFGFYLIRNIRNFSDKIKISGFQHGIFSNNLMWLDLINSLNHRKMYIPNNIYCLNKFSLQDYKIKYKNVKISLIQSKKKSFNFLNKIRIKKKSNNILVLAGLHDAKDLYFFLKNKAIRKDNKIFYFKLHPKSKFNFISEKRIKKIVSFEKKFFTKVIISQTSSLPYDFLKSGRYFSVIDFDYKQNLISSNLKNNKKIDFLKD